ncbi:hypothetical protein [Candidatus Clostridium stratigraminis]|uniref:Uncharacterized protein n=1 Tax=Candidatus Clostridium stratigraminis TaxID=3381661 RepID=A0ABW8T4L7_9CLOT
MNKKCIICKNRKSCLTYDLGGLYDGEYCSKFIEEPEITEEEQERQQQEKLKNKSVCEKLIKKIKHS